jgi:hypothetical protein
MARAQLAWIFAVLLVCAAASSARAEDAAGQGVWTPKQVEE